MLRLIINNHNANDITYSSCISKYVGLGVPSLALYKGERGKEDYKVEEI